MRRVAAAALAAACAASLPGAAAEAKAPMFGDPVRTKSPMWPGPFAVDDFDRDGRSDLVMTYINQRTDPPDELWLADGRGGFTRKALPTRAQDVAAADLNRDGNPDLLAASRYLERVNVFLGDGRGNFPPRETAGAGRVLRRAPPRPLRR